MMNQTNETASIDLTIAFFSAVLVLFVFVEFNTTRKPPDPAEISTGQTELTQAARPATWQTVNRRGGFGLYLGNDLKIFNMPAVGEGIVDIFQSSPEPGTTGLSTIFQGAAPESFSVLWRFVPDAPPEHWLAQVIPAEALGTGDCPEALPPSLNIFVWKGAVDVAPLVRFAEICGVTLRYELFAPANGLDASSSRRIALTPQSYSAERVFR